MQPDKDYYLTGRILQKIYDSEIHFSIGWMFDGGIDYSIGRDLVFLHDGKISSTLTGKLHEAMPLIADEISKEYPSSEFAKWWVKVR